MNINHLFASNVKKIRQQQGLSQERLGELAGLHRTFISAVECERRNISIENVQRIAEALGVAPFKLFLEDENEIYD